MSVQPVTRASSKYPPPLDEGFAQELVPERELTRLAPVGNITFPKLHSLNKNGNEKRYYSIDTTTMLQKVLDDDEYNCLCILGPRRFGKTLNMNMFECFMDSYCLAMGE